MVDERDADLVKLPTERKTLKSLRRIGPEAQVEKPQRSSSGDAVVVVMMMMDDHETCTGWGGI